MTRSRLAEPSHSARSAARYCISDGGKKASFRQIRRSKGYMALLFIHVQVSWPPPCSVVLLVQSNARSDGMATSGRSALHTMGYPGVFGS